jgi:hypothetical protein
MRKDEVVSVLKNRLLNKIKDSEKTRIDEVAQLLAEFLVDEEMVTEGTLFGCHPPINPPERQR